MAHILADSNLFIYAGKGTFDTETFIRQTVHCSIITTVEALGYYELPVQELRALEVLFAWTIVLPLTDEVAQQAIVFRQAKKKMQLGDAIIAATAILNDLELWTANDKDFRHITELRLFNPYSAR
jgi:predicted nucleic acid-binding protein